MLPAWHTWAPAFQAQALCTVDPAASLLLHNLPLSAQQATQ